MNTRNFGIALACLLSASAVAAPFCVVTGGGTNCFYYDAQSCRQAAGASGACVVNPSEGQPDGGPGQGSGIRFGTVAPGIELYNQNIREGDRQRAEDRQSEIRQFETEQRRQEYVTQNTDPRLLPLRPDGEFITPATQSIIMSTLFTTLDMNAPGTSRDWGNPQTGASGTVLAKEIVQNLFGEPCRAFTVSLKTIRGQERSTSGNACRKNGQWIWPGN